MRDAMVRLGGDPTSINPLTPIDFIVDHSVIAEVTGQDDAFQKNLEIEYARNRERFAFLKWAQQTYENIRIIPPGNGIMHQINWNISPAWCGAKNATARPSPIPTA